MYGWIILLSMTGALAFAAQKELPDKTAPPKRAPVFRPPELLKCKPPGAKEEASVREAAEAANFSDHEVLSRLILSESLSTGFWHKRCDAPNAEALMESIGWGVMARVAKYSPKRDDPKPDAIFHVIFAQRQFATSFSGYNDNIFARVFLCPLEAIKYLERIESEEDGYAIYTTAKTVAARILEKYQKNGVDPAYMKITHFFYPYSEFGGEKRPAWAKDSDPTKNKGYLGLVAGEKPCAEFYQR